MTGLFGGLDVAMFRQLAASAPAFLVEHLLERQDCWSSNAVRQLCEGVWPVLLVRGTSVHDAIQKRLPRGKRPVELDPGPPAVWCLCVRPDPWSLNPDVRFGTPQRMTVSPYRPFNQTDFERSCTAGVSAAMAWLQSKTPLGQLPQEWRFEPVGILGRTDGDPDPEGGSAGLAAALASVEQVLGAAGVVPDRHVAATGAIDPHGKVEPIGWLREKLEGIVREAPFIQRVYVPDGNASDVPSGLPFDVIPVDSVAAALDHLWAGADFGRFKAFHSPEHAAAEAFRLEMEQRHGQAEVLAGQVLAVLDEAGCSSRKLLLAKVQALAVRALNLTHVGRTAEALEDFKRIDDLCASTEAVGLHLSVPIDLRALVVAARASALFDALECERAIGLSAELTPRMDDLSGYAAIRLMGSLLRCQAAAGFLDAAESTWGTYSDLIEEPEYKPEMWCHRIELLVKRVLRGQATTLDETRRALEQGREANTHVVSDHERSENARYLDLAECRICAVAGDARRAVELAGPIPVAPSQMWPEHHLHRLAGEALSRAGHVEEALVRLEAARRCVDPKAPAFKKLVLLTAGAREALLRLELERNGWEEPAMEFVGAYERYKPGRFDWPEAGAGTRGWRDCLERALDSIPY